MNIIQLRLEKALRVAYQTSIRHQELAPNRRRRGSYRNGVSVLSHSINIRVNEAMKGRLDHLCAALNVERGVVLRDAMEMYLGIAEVELHAHPVVPTTLRRRA